VLRNNSDGNGLRAIWLALDGGTGAAAGKESPAA